MSTLHASQDLINLIKQTILDTSYPIGNIIVTINNKNPSTYLGGTWSKIGSGRTLFSASNDSQLGNTIDSGLPNIIGGITTSWIDDSGGGIIMYHQDYGNNAMYTSKDVSTNSRFAATTNRDNCDRYSWMNHINIDASRVSSVYGRSSIVQPPAVYVYFWRRIA